jgi:HD-GYP domain-containing protein (c-di-GMP phosphodiesterase class II)/HAMP domain-containing protein
MRRNQYRIEFSFLRSKIARRIFFLFIGCSLFPISALALFAYFQVSSNLNRLSERRLHQASKSTGMAIVERLSSLDTDLQLIIANLPSQKNASIGAFPADMRTRIMGRFRSLSVAAADGRALFSLYGGMPKFRQISDEERHHLFSGATLIATSHNADGSYGIFISRLLDTVNPIRGELLGEINPDYLWSGEALSSLEAEVFVLGPDHEPLFSTASEETLMPALEKALSKDAALGRFEWSQAGDRFYASYWTAFMRPQYFSSFIVVHGQKRDDILQPLHTFAKAFVLVVLLTFWVVILISLKQIRRSLIPVEILRDATEKIKAKDFSHRVLIESKDELAQLGESFNSMTESMENHYNVIHTMNDIGVSLSIQKDEAKLLELILSGAQSVFNADGAALYLLSKDDQLKLSMFRINSLSLRLNGSSAVSPGRFGGGDKTSIGEMWMSVGAAERTIFTPDAYSARDGSMEPLYALDRETGYHSCSFLSVPLRNHENEAIGILQLINAQARNSSRIVAFSDEDQRMAESLASQAAVALTKNRLVNDFKGLFEGLTELISTAIDAKSAYTGGHVRRVVVLAMMIAKAISRSKHPAFRNVDFSEDELYELRIAALLHDCGKLITPVHIIDKATKLETIHDRMHQVELRAEVIRRDHRIKLLEETVRSMIKTNDREPFRQIESTASSFDLRLKNDLAFLRTSNNGTESITEADRERIRAIAEQYRWTDGEQAQKSIVEQDELENLTISSGTLTPQEREIINAHVISTLNMLSKLPYPKRLRNVPQYAGTHHEHMDGTGYPMKLTAPEIPLQGRIIGIADVFEALTAQDRPYKKAINADEALSRLQSMAQNGHIDADLYQLLVNEKIHLEYSKIFLEKDLAAATI